SRLGPVTQKRNAASVRRPDRAVVVRGVSGQPQRRACADLLNVDIRIVLLGSGPRERYVVAVGGERWISHDPWERGKRNRSERRGRRVSWSQRLQSEIRDRRDGEKCGPRPPPGSMASH